MAESIRGICFSVVPGANPRSLFVNSQLVCLLPVRIFNTLSLFEIFVFVDSKGILLNDLSLVLA